MNEHLFERSPLKPPLLSSSKLVTHFFEEGDDGVLLFFFAHHRRIPQRELKRRDFIGISVTLALGANFAKLLIDEVLMKVDGQEVTDDEKECAKEAMAVFAASSPAGGEPDPKQVADKGRLAIRAWRELAKG